MKTANIQIGIDNAVSMMQSAGFTPGPGWLDSENEFCLESQEMYRDGFCTPKAVIISKMDRVEFFGFEE
jgi:hypothetical protein